MFNKWSVESIEVKDQGLKRYISLNPVIVPRTSGRNVGSKFHKSRVNIVERLMNKIMIPGHKSKKHFKSSGHCTGKGITAFSIMEDVLTIVENQTKKNPVEVLVRAVENAAPREEIITIEYGGARYPKAVECAPQRRVDIVLRYFVQGAYQKSFNSKKPFRNALAEEILNAHNLNGASVAISKKMEVERQADSSR